MTLAGPQAKAAKNPSMYQQMVVKNAILGNKDRQVKRMRLTFPEGVDPRYFTCKREPGRLMHELNCDESIKSIVSYQKEKDD